MTSAIQAFLVKLAIKLAVRLHKGPAHELAEKWRKEIEANDAKK